VGVAAPAEGNPADHALDVITGHVRAGGCADADAAGAALRAAWAREAAPAAAAAAAVSALTAAPAGAASAASGASFVAQIVLQARRAAVVRLRAWRQLLLYGGLHVGLAAALASGFSPLIQKGSYVSDGGQGQYSPPVTSILLPYCPTFLRGLCAQDVSHKGLIQMMFFVSVACGSGSGIAGVQLFGGTHTAARREADAGASALAAGLGRMAADLPIVFANAAAFCALWVLLAASGLWARWLAIYAGIAFAASGFGYLVAQLTSPSNAAMLISISMLAFAVFNGATPSLAAVQPLPIVNWLWYLSFATYVSEAVYYTYTAFEAPVRAVSAAAENAFGFAATESVFLTSIGAMFGLGLLWRLCALLALWAVTR
jgi:hypothetical protein